MLMPANLRAAVDDEPRGLEEACSSAARGTGAPDVARRSIGHLLIFAACAVLCLSATPARATQLDPSFGGAGWVRTYELPGASFHLEDANDVAVQPDGKIVVAADVSGPLGEREWVVVRYLPDGLLDPGFGNGGGTVVGMRAQGVARALALQRDGKIVVTGDALCEDLEKCFGAARLNPDGSLDAGFGVGGIARHAPVRRTEAHDVAVQPDGRIVLAGGWFRGGDANDDDLACVMRLLPDGRLDPAFSRDGVVRLDHGHGDDDLEAVAIQGRRIVVAGAGRLIAGSRGGFAVVRFRPDGSLDRTFGRRGRRIVSFGRRWATPVALATGPRGRLVIAGNTGTGVERWQPAVARLTRGGSLDRSFGSGGRVRTPVRPFGGGAMDVQVDARGRVLLAGDAYSDAARDAADWALVRYTGAGRIDRSLAADGVFRGDFSPVAERASALALAGDRLVAAGAVGSTLGVARFVLP
jgi:uncharacterized delta-60 repeat protein